MGFAGSAQVPDPREIFDLQIRQGIREAVPIFFDFVLGKIQGWLIWVDKELSDVEFMGRLKCVGILKAWQFPEILRVSETPRGSGI